MIQLQTARLFSLMYLNDEAFHRSMSLTNEISHVDDVDHQDSCTTN